MFHFGFANVSGISSIIHFLPLPKYLMLHVFVYIKKIGLLHNIMSKYDVSVSSDMS